MSVPLEFFEVFVEQLAPRFDDGHRAAAHELFARRRVASRRNSACVSALWPVFFDDDVVVVDLQDADIVLAYEFLDVAAARDFIKGDLLLHDFVRGVDEDLEHVDLLLDLPRELLDPVGAGADDDREFMDARERRLGSRQAFDVTCGT